MSADPEPNRFTFRDPHLPDDGERLGDAEQAFNAEAEPEQAACQGLHNDYEPLQQPFTANGVPEPTPSGTRTLRRYRFTDEEREQDSEQTEEIDLSSGEWVIEFEPETSDQAFDLDH